MRVEGFWKISATLRPASAREESGAAFSSSARVEQRVELGGRQLGPGEEVAWWRWRRWRHGRASLGTRRCEGGRAATDPGGCAVR